MFQPALAPASLDALPVGPGKGWIVVVEGSWFGAHAQIINSVVKPAIVGEDSLMREKIWRDRLIDRLRDHPEGFVQYSRLVPGRPYGLVIPGSNGKT